MAKNKKNEKNKIALPKVSIESTNDMAMKTFKSGGVTQKDKGDVKKVYGYKQTVPKDATALGKGPVAEKKQKMFNSQKEADDYIKSSVQESAKITPGTGVDYLKRMGVQSRTSEYDTASYDELTRMSKTATGQERYKIDAARVRAANPQQRKALRSELQAQYDYYAPIYSDSKIMMDKYQNRKAAVTPETYKDTQARMQNSKEGMDWYSALLGEVDDTIRNIADDNTDVTFGRKGIENGARKEYVPTKNKNTQYDYINMYQRGELSESDVQSGLIYPEYTVLTPYETNILNSLPENKRESYLSAKSDVLKKRYNEKQQAEAIKYAQEHPISAGLDSVVQGAFWGIPSAVDNVVEGITGDVDTYDMSSRAIRQADTYRSVGSQKIREKYGDVAGIAYDTGLTLLDVGVNVLAGKTVGTGLGHLGIAAGKANKIASGVASASMSGRAASSTMTSIADRGGSDFQIVTGGLASGLAEFIFEKYSLDKLLSTRSAVGVGNIIKSIATQSAIEGSEEIFTEAANMVTDAIIMQGKSESEIRRRELMLSYGLPAEEAVKQVVQENIMQIAKAGGMGALAGGIMGSGAIIAANASHASYMKRAGEKLIESPDTMNRVLEIGIANNNAEANHTAQMIADGMKIDSAAAGKMMESVLSQSMEKNGGLMNIMSTIEAIEGRDGSRVASKESIDTAKAVMHMVQGKVTDVDRALISRSRGAVTLLTSIEGHDAAWESVKKAAGEQLRVRGEEMQMQSGTLAEQATPQGEAFEDGEIYSQGERVTIPENSRIIKNIVLDDESMKVRRRDTQAYKNVEMLAQDLGMRVKYVNNLTDSAGTALDGVITSQGIFINSEAKNPSRFVATHEFSHRMKQVSAEQWQKYESFVIKKLQKDGRYENIFNKKAAAYDNADESYINEEIAADYIGELFENETELAELIKESRRDAVTIRDVWYKILDKLGLSSEKEKAQRMWRDAYKAAMKNKDMEFEDDPKFKIITMSDGSGRKYVHATQKVIKSKNPDMWESEIMDYVNSVVRKGEDVVIPLDNEESIVITGRTAWKLSGQGKLQDNYYLIKGNAAGVIDEIIGVSKSVDAAPPYKEHSDGFAKYGFNYRTAYFMDIDGKYYKLKLSVGINVAGKEAYDIESIKRETFPSQGSKAKATKATGKSPLTPMVSQNTPDVNTNPMQKVEKDARKSVSGARISDIEAEKTTGFKKNSLIKKIQSNLAELSNEDVVLSLNTDVFNDRNKNIVEQVGSFFDMLGNAVHRPNFGEVVLNKKGIKSSIGHKMGRAKCIAFRAVPDIIRYGRQIDFQEQWKGRPYDSYVFAGKVKIGGEEAYVGVVVTKSANKNEYYLHEIVDGEGNFITIKNDEVIPNKTVSETDNGLHGGTTSPIDNTISQDEDVVNKNDMQNGENDAKYTAFMEEYSGLHAFRPAVESGWLSQQWRTERSAGNEEAAKSLKEIADLIVQEFNIPITNRKFKDEQVTGNINLTTEAIHTRARNDIITISHEIGHLLDKKLQLQDANGIKKLVEVLDRTLATLGYGEKAKKTEAIGEFVRMYLTNRDIAKDVAPEFYAEFESRVSQSSYKDAVNKLAYAANAYLSASIKERVGLSIAEDIDMRSWKEKAKDTASIKPVKEKLSAAKEFFPELWKMLNYEFVDRFYAIGEAQGRLYAKNPEGKENAHLLATNSLNSSARAAYILTKSFVNMDGEEIGNSFIDCLMPIAGKSAVERAKNISALNRYLVLKHALEWIEPKKVNRKTAEKKRVFADQSLENPNVLRAEIAEMEKTLPELKEVAENIYQYLRNLKKYWGVDTGVMTEKLSKTLDNMYPCYVPFFRESGRKGIRGARVNLANQRAPILEAHGGSELIVNPLESIIGLTEKYVKTASRNMAMQAMAHIADSHGGSGFIIERVGDGKQPILQTAAEIKSKDMAEATPEELENITAEEDDWHGEYKHGQGFVSVLIGGEKVWYQINDKHLFKAVADMETKQLNKFFKACNVILNTKKLLITSNNPLFATTNVVRDAITAYNNIDINNPFDFIAAYFTALKHVIKKDPNYKRWCAMGGGHASELSSSMNDVNRALGKAMQISPGAKILNTVLHPIEAVASINDIVESTPRLLAFEHEMKRSGDVHKAIYKADDITTNFKRGGRTAKNLNTMFMFSNSAIQGLDRTIRSFTQNDTELGRRNRIIKYALTAVFATLLQQVWNRRNDEEEENYENLSAYMRRSNYVINLTGGRFLRIPTAREQDLLRVIISDCVNRAFGDKDAFDGLVGFVLDSFIPPYIEMPADLSGDKEFLPELFIGSFRNTPIGTFTDLAVNSNFTGSPIVPQSYENVTAEKQYDEKTSKLAVFLSKTISKSKFLGIFLPESPFKIDYIINNNFGILGTINKSIAPMDKSQRDYSFGLGNRWIADSYYSTDVLNKVYTKRNAAEEGFKRFEDGKSAAEYEKLQAITDFISQYNKALKELPDNEKRAGRKKLLDIINSWGSGNSVAAKEMSRLFDTTGENVFMKMPAREISTFSGKKKLGTESYTEYIEKYTAAFEAGASTVLNESIYNDMSDVQKAKAFKTIAEYAKGVSMLSIEPDAEVEKWIIDVFDEKTSVIDKVIEDNKGLRAKKAGQDIYKESRKEGYSIEEYNEDIEKYTKKGLSQKEITDAVKEAARGTKEYQQLKRKTYREINYDSSEFTDAEIKSLEDGRKRASGHYADKEHIPGFVGQRSLEVYDEYLSESMSLEEFLTHRARAQKTAAMADGNDYLNADELEIYINSLGYDREINYGLFEALKSNKKTKNRY